MYALLELIINFWALCTS